MMLIEDDDDVDDDDGFDDDDDDDFSRWSGANDFLKAAQRIQTTCTAQWQMDD